MPRLSAGLAAALLAVGAGAAMAQGAAVATPTPTVPPDPHVLRLWAYEGLKPLLLRWEQGYRQQHPEMRFENQFHVNAAVMAGLYNGVAEFALMGRELWLNDTMAYQWVYQQRPFGVTVATAGLEGPGQSYTPVIVVNAKNPLQTISLGQLDAIYGSQHRAAPANIRTWGELGLTGAWAEKPIHVYGYAPEDALGAYFRHEVLRSDFMPNTASHLLSDREGGKVSAASRITQAVAADPLAIGYTRLPAVPTVKVLEVQATGAETGGPALVPSEATLRDHRYPLTRSITLYLQRFPGRPLAPGVESFLQFVLSAEGQALIRPGDGVLPLTPELVEEQEQKIAAPMPKATTPTQESAQ